MSLTVSDLITAAKGATAGQTGRQRVANRMLLEELNHQDSLLVQFVSQYAPDLLATVSGSETVTLADNQSGYTLETGIHYRDFTHVDTAEDEYVPINVVQRQWQDEVARHPSAVLGMNTTGAVLYPVDPDGDRWQSSGARTWFEGSESHEIHYSYVPTPGTLSALSDTLTSPDMARPVFVAALALAILVADPEATDRAIEAAAAKYGAAMASFRWQIHKFTHPQGQRPTIWTPTDTGWVAEQVGG